MRIQKITVLGSGLMGRQIAAHLLNAGLEVDLIKMRSSKGETLAQEPYEYIVNPKNKLLYEPASISNLSYYSYSDFLREKSDADLVIEAIVEDLEIKQDVWQEVAELVDDSCILATNTSGLSVSGVSEKLDKTKRNRFLGIHFFTPVRTSRLVEIIAQDSTDEKVVSAVQEFILHKLGKNYIEANDVVGFLANRIGFFTNHDIMYRGEEKEWPITTVDVISGEAIGRTKMGPYRLTDFSGIDLSDASYENYAADEREAPFFKGRTKHQVLLENKWYGDKSGQGYYKKENGKRYTINFETGEYEAASFPTFDIFSQFEKGQFSHNFNVIFNSEDDIGEFMWESLRNVMHYAAVNVGYATENYKDIDRAMVWGYNWSVGPFQIWDLIGLDRVKERMRKELGELPEWIEERNTPFYDEAETLAITPSAQELAEKVIWQREQQSALLSTADDILIFLIRTKNNTINPMLLEDMLEAVDKLENEAYQGLVIASEGKNFSVGYDVNLMKENIDSGDLKDSLNVSSDLGHELVSRIKYAKKPLVTAIQGYALGGGAEIAMLSPKTIAAAETYIGLTEVGVGLIPGGGGLSELADRIYRTDHSRYEKKRLMNEAFTLAAYGIVSNNGFDAIQKGLLKETDNVVMNADFVIQAAVDWVQFVSKYSFSPLYQTSYPALGSDFKAVVQGTTRNWTAGEFVTDYDKVLADTIADVLAGGDIPMGTHIDQSYLMKKEKENFIKLSQNKETYDRMNHMMKTNRPLRN